MTRIILILAMLTLAGCARASAVKDALQGGWMEFHDEEARSIKALNCVASFGGVLRTYTPEEEAAARVLCRGSMADFIKFQEIQKAKEAEKAKASEPASTILIPPAPVVLTPSP